MFRNFVSVEDLITEQKEAAGHQVNQCSIKPGVVAKGVELTVDKRHIYSLAKCSLQLIVGEGFFLTCSCAIT